MPNTFVLLDIKKGVVQAEIQIPMQQLSIAVGKNFNTNAHDSVDKYSVFLNEYFTKHLKPTSINGKPWRVIIESFSVISANDPAIGKYNELVLKVSLIPDEGGNYRHFIFDYDAVIHQVVTHVIMISIRNDWQNGILAENPIQVGIIQTEVQSNRYYPLVINLDSGGWWKGFASMITMGIKHIAAGTDHLLFLLTLLLPAMLLVNGKRWGLFGGTKYSLIRLIKIVTAFTLGHSITLLVGAMGWVKLPQQPIEILIAISILVSAIHAIRPVFAGKEIYIAAGFGLVHGLAFASVLSNLSLDTEAMVLSILGFNIGIELMQIFIIILISPWLILLAQTPQYHIIRITGAILATIAAIAWISERISGQTNLITTFINQYSQYTVYMLVFLSIYASLSFYFYVKRGIVK